MPTTLPSEISCGGSVRVRFTDFKWIDTTRILSHGWLMVSTPQRLTVIFFYLAASLLTSSAESPFKFESTPGKLPKGVVPRHYAIRLQPDLEKFITIGKVDINIEVLKPAREIVLNALDL